jgi:thymidine kinase
MARTLGPIPFDRWEREVLNQLKNQLPGDWVVVSNVTWAIAGDGGYVKDGQADFVVLVPDSGMVVLEVKGSREIWIDEDGCWYRSDNAGGKVFIPKSPPEQAMGNMHELARIVQQKGGWPGFPGRYSWIVAYPNGLAKQVPALFDASTLVTSRHMHELAPRIRRALEGRGFNGVAHQFTSATVGRVAEILTSRPFAVTKADTSVDIQDDVAQIDNLTRQQFAALKGVFELPKVAVIGPAGSGKTLLAIWKLQALKDAARRAIYVCFNTKLAESLKKRNPDHADSIVSVDKFFSSLCPDAPRPTDLAEHFRQALPLLAFDVAENLPEESKFDTIIVDEGQDFNELQLYALNELLRRDGGEWIIFTDRRQDLFRAGSGEAFGAEVVFQLYHNCRNTRQVNTATNRYLGQRPIDSMPGMPEGEPPTVALCTSKETIAMRVWELAKQWSTDRGVVILSPYVLANSSMASSRKGHGLTLTESLGEIGKPGTVYFSTIRSFKGIEAPAVILIDTSIPSEHDKSVFRHEDLYVACTRPTARIAILTQDAGAYEWFSSRLEPGIQER